MAQNDESKRRKQTIRYICDDPLYQYYPEFQDLYCIPVASNEEYSPEDSEKGSDDAAE